MSVLSGFEASCKTLYTNSRNLIGGITKYMTKGVFYIIYTIYRELRTLLLLPFLKKLVLSDFFCKTLTKLNKNAKTKSQHQKRIRTRNSNIIRE